ncbi:MAG: efflux RND transporter periplasmic adaptor subunit [Myxococcota bacterium]
MDSCRFPPPGVRAMGLGVLLACAFACEDPPEPPPDAPRLVKMIEVGGGGATGVVAYPGRIKSADEAALSFPIGGRLSALSAAEGATVREGAVLAKLDAQTQQSQLESALARQRAAKAEYDRQLALFASDAASKQDLDLARRNYEVSQAEVRAARKALQDTVIRAPFTGTIGRRYKENFETVQPKEAVILLVNRGRLEVEIDIPEGDIASGRTRMNRDEVTRLVAPRVTVASLPDRIFEASVKEAASSADPVTRTFRVTLSLQEAGEQILPGMTAEVALDLGALNALSDEGAKSSFALPSHAVMAGDDETSAFVWVVDRETMQVSKRAVTLGPYSGDTVQVTAGLDRGDLLAISGVKLLREGQEVRRYVPKRERQS